MRKLDLVTKKKRAQSPLLRAAKRKRIAEYRAGRRRRAELPENVAKRRERALAHKKNMVANHYPSAKKESVPTTSSKERTPLGKVKDVASSLAGKYVRKKLLNSSLGKKYEQTRVGAKAGIKAAKYLVGREVKGYVDKKRKKLKTNLGIAGFASSFLKKLLKK